VYRHGASTVLEQSKARRKSTSNVFHSRPIPITTKGCSIAVLTRKRYLDRVHAHSNFGHRQNPWVKIRIDYHAIRTQSSPVRMLGFFGRYYSWSNDWQSLTADGLLDDCRKKPNRGSGVPATSASLRLCVFDSAMEGFLTHRNAEDPLGTKYCAN